MIVPNHFDGASEPEWIDTATLVEAVRGGWERAAASKRRISPELAVALTIAARPVLGDPDALPALPVDPDDLTFEEPDPELIVDPVEDEDRSVAAIQSLLEEYEREYLPLLESAGPPDRVGMDLFVAHAMLSYKAQYSNGKLGDWPLEELEEFMLEWWPRKVSADEDTELTAPASISRFLGFLDARDSLSGSNPKRLANAITELLEPFLDTCEDPGNWGPAKSLVTRAASSGVDVHDRQALDAYLTEAHPRSSQQATPRSQSSAVTSGPPRPPQAAKSSRRRNRR